MAKGTRVCRVCGKEYEYCHSVKTWDGVNRWQDIACCPEHGAQYFAEVLGGSGARANVEYQSLVSSKDATDTTKPVKKSTRSKKIAEDVEEDNKD